MSINLGRGVYRGGVLQLRDGASKKVLQEVSNVGPGDGVVFQLSGGLEHRVTAVEGAVAKTTFAGWFCSTPDCRALFKGVGRRRRLKEPLGTLDTAVKVSPEAIYQSIGEEGMIFHFKARAICKLNSVGSRMWKLLAKTHSLQAAFEVLVREYDVDSATLERDLLRLVRELRAEEFLEVVDR